MIEIYEEIMDQAHAGLLAGPEVNEQLKLEGLDEYGNFTDATTDFEQWKSDNPQESHERETAEYNRSFCFTKPIS